MAKPFRIFSSVAPPSMESLQELRYPGFASIKIDGVRCVVREGVVYTGRNMKRVINQRVQELLHPCEGLDGELTVGDPYAQDACRATQKVVNALDADIGGITYHVYDITDSPETFGKRNTLLFARTLALALVQDKKVPIRHHKQQYIETYEELVAFIDKAYQDGHEGVIYKTADGLYKQGKSTWKEGTNIKIKQLLDAEAVILEVIEGEKNCNEATVNNAGLTERSSHKVNMVPNGMVGAFAVQDPINFPGVTFKVGAGKLTNEQAKRLFALRDTLVGKVLTYQYAPHGIKDAPRFPLFKLFRQDLTRPELEKLGGEIYQDL